MSDEPRTTEPIPPFLRATAKLGGLFVECFTRVRVEGLENVPVKPGPLIIAANHASNADGGFLLAWLTPALQQPIQWMGKAEALDWPVAGRFLKGIQVFGVRREAADTEAFKLAKSYLDAGQSSAPSPRGRARRRAPSRPPRRASRSWRSEPARRSCRSGSRVRTVSGPRAS